MALNAILLFLGDLGGGEIMIIMIAVLLLFGANKIPGIARSLGSGIREFKDAASGIRQELEKSINEEPAKTKIENQYTPPAVAETHYGAPLAEDPYHTPSEPKKLDQMD